MAKPLQCPQCGASECNLIEDNRYRCNFCGSIFIYGNAKKFQQEQIPVKQNYDNAASVNAPKKIAGTIGCFSVVSMIVFAAIAVIIFRSQNQSSDASSLFGKNYTETNNHFITVNTEKGIQIWTASTRDVNNSTEESYYLNQLNPTESKPYNSILLGTTNETNYLEKEKYKVKQLKYFGNTCYAVIGESKLIGYDVNTQEEIINNEAISNNFSELKNGIAKVEDVYDMNGFKLTTKDGFVYYFLPTEKITKNADVRTLGKLLTDKEYDNRFSKQALGDEENVTEYCFTKGERQKLYVVNRKVSTVLKQKLSPSTLSDIVEENDNWYKRSYKINSVEEFTPSKIYFNATVLYTDESHIITLFQNEAGDNATTVTLQCLNTDKTIKWTKTGADVELFKKMVKSTNSSAIKNGTEIAIMQPYVAAVGVDSETGNINWTFKPY